MKAEALDLRTILGRDRRLIAPLFQRPYVWTKSKQWRPLWNDIRRMADKLHAGDTDVRPHFLGAVVLDQLRNPVGSLESRWVIDGQQRLATLQVFLAAFRDICMGIEGCGGLGTAAARLAENSDDPAVQSEVERFKVWPTNVDQKAYRLVMTAGSWSAIRQAVRQGTDPNLTDSNIIAAYRYFHDAIPEWLGDAPEQQEAKVKALLNAIREKLYLVPVAERRFPTRRRGGAVRRRVIR